MGSNIIPSWDEYFLLLCNVIKLRSKDPKRQVGACLVSLKDNRIISTGYNSLKQGVNDNIDWSNRELVHSLVLHAECNVLLYSKSNFEDSILYCTTSPCCDCIKSIAAANVKKIIYLEKYKDIEKVTNICNFYNIELVEYKL
jgi:dCMP deaminase